MILQEICQEHLKTHSLPIKDGGWKASLSFLKWSLFREHASFRGGNKILLNNLQNQFFFKGGWLSSTKRTWQEIIWENLIEVEEEWQDWIQFDKLPWRNNMGERIPFQIYESITLLILVRYIFKSIVAIMVWTYLLNRKYQSTSVSKKAKSYQWYHIRR